MTPEQRVDALRFADWLQDGADDPMWADHAEMRKTTLGRTAALLRELASETKSDPDWTLLLVGPENGLVGKYGHNFPGSPEHYERVHVVRADGIGRAA